jgi:redox-sensitive bicupin YhaK (pirin superfamily)
MITIRRADSLGLAHSDTLTLRCHFAFADYQAPQDDEHEGRLRAINLGTIPSQGCYQLGPEANVDIITWLRSGSLRTHVEDFPAESIHSGGLHLLSTGAGVHAMAWQAGADGASFIQFWLLADTEGGEPTQEAREAFSKLEDGGFRIVASGFPEDDPEEMEVIDDGAPVTLRALSRVLHADIPAGEGAAYQTMPGRDLYVLVVRGGITICDMPLSEGDGAMLTQTERVVVMATQDAVVILTDIAS